MTTNEWITEWRSRGYWCQRCPACGWWYAQKRLGRRSFLCGKARCDQWHKYQHTHGRAPPAWMLAKWLGMYGDRSRANHPKRGLVPSRAA